MFFILALSSLYSQVRIIGGGEIDIRKAPWTANMRIVNSAGVRLFNRSGIIVSENLILTASHNWPQYSHLEAHVGGASETEGKYFRIHKVIHHPSYDITLLELSESLEFNESIQPINYRECTDESLYVPGTAAIVYGWGKNSLTLPASLRLRSVNVEIISRDEANSAYGASVVPENSLVSRGSTIQMAGKGDSGGPLVVLNGNQTPVLVGITMLADTRDEVVNSGLTVYAKVKHVIEWIDGCKCELAGNDVVPPTGMSFTLTNMPLDMKSVEWTYSGLIKVDSGADYINVIPSNIGEEVAGRVSAKITTSSGTLTISKRLVIMPRIDIDISIKYNEITSKYEMNAKTVNMEAVDNSSPTKSDIVDDIKELGFIWTYNSDMAMGKRVIFDINPDQSRRHTVTVNKYNQEYTFKLKKTFIIQHNNNDFITLHSEHGMITIKSVNLTAGVVTEDLQVSHIRDAVESSISVNTSQVTVENPHTIGAIDKLGNYKVAIYSRTGHLMYSSYFNNETDPLHINISEFSPDIYILYICNSKNNSAMSRMLMINSL
jgi:chymotrypsin